MSEAKSAAVVGGGDPDTSGASSRHPARCEPRDVPPLLPLWLGLLIAVFTGGVLLSISVGFPTATHQQYRGPLRALPPTPRLQSAPAADLQRYDSAKRQELEARKGAAEQPIEAAMRATAKQGWGPPK